MEKAAGKNLAVAAPAAPAGTQLITLDPKTYVTQVFAPFVDRLAAAKVEAAKVAIDVSTKPGMALAVKHRAAFRTLRIEAENERVARKAPILAIGKLLDTRNNELAAEIEKDEDRFDAAIKAEERRKDEERQAAIRADQDRRAAIQDRISALYEMPAALVGASTDGIQVVLVKLQAEDPSAWAQERTEDARKILAEAIAKVERMHTAALAAEQEAARIAAEAQRQAEARKQLEAEQAALREAQEKAEQARLAAEQASKLRIEEEERAARMRREEDDRQARAAREQAEREALEKQQLNQAALSAISGIQQQVIIAQAGRLGFRVGGTLQCIEDTLAETEAWTVEPAHFGAHFETAKKAKETAVDQIRALLEAAKARAAEDARLKAERERLEVERAAADEAQRKARVAKELKEAAERRAEEERQRAERDRQEAEVRARAEAERKLQLAQEERQREEQRRLAELADGYELLQTFVARYGEVEAFADVTVDIKEFLADAPIPVPA